MKTKKFRGALLSILIVTSLMVPAIIAISSISVDQVSANPGYTVIVWGTETSCNFDGDGVAPWRWYGPEPGKTPNPPIMATNTYGSGRIAAAGFAATCRNTRWDSPFSSHKHLDALLDATFKWLRPTGGLPGRDNVLWYGEDRVDENVYNDVTYCSSLIEALKTRGYKVDNTINTPPFITGEFTPITSALLAPYDILVIPQMELGDIGTGGDPRLIMSDNAENIIKAFVNNGGGLLFMEGYDSFGYNYCWVSDNILKAVNMDIYFQSDTLSDEEAKLWYTHSTYDYVDSSTEIGQLFLADPTVDDNRIGLYIPNSLAERHDHEVTLSVKPVYRMAFPGTTFTCDVTFSHPGWVNDNITLSIDNIWPATLSGGQVFWDNVGLASKKTTLTVTIPSENKFGDTDTITVTATCGSGVTNNATVVAIASMRVGPPLQDTYITQFAREAVNPLGSYIWMQVGSSPENNKRAFVQFDLSALSPGKIPPGNLSIDSIHARLFVHCGSISALGMPGKNVQCLEVDNDTWLENEMKGWENQPPQIGAVLDTTKVAEAGQWYSWDATSYVIEQFKGDNKATFCLKAETENLTYPDNFIIYSFDTSNLPLKDNFRYPYLVIGYDVSTQVSPDYDGLPGGTLTSTVYVQNIGSFVDNFDLYKENIWNATLSENRFLNVQPMETRTATLTIKIPSGAAIGENDNVRITAVSWGSENKENDVGSCFARASSHVSAWEDSTTRAPLHLENSTLGLLNVTGLEKQYIRIWVGRLFASQMGLVDNGPERGWLKFDLRAIPSLAGVQRVNLSLYLGDNTGSSQVRCYGVTDDSWRENEITWHNQPSIGSPLDERTVTEKDRRYTWDVTSFVQSQFAGDNKASFCLVDLGENIGPGQYVHSTNFTSKEDENMDRYPYLEILSALPTREVRASIDPVFQGGLAGDNLQYTVTVKNTGTAADTYNLTVENTETWPWLLGNNSLVVPAGENRTTTLSVYISSGTIGTVDNVTINVRSQGDSTKYDNTRCFAHRGKATFVMENLYKVSIDESLILREDADNLIANFRTYGDVTQENKSVWDNAWPWQLIRKENVSRAVGNPVEKVRLVLTGGSDIQIVASWTATKAVLASRYLKIKSDYVKPGADKPALAAEYLKIKSQYVKAP